MANQEKQIETGAVVLETLSDEAPVKGKTENGAAKAPAKASKPKGQKAKGLKAKASKPPKGQKPKGQKAKGLKTKASKPPKGQKGRSYGQTGPTLHLEPSDLNDDEKAVVKVVGKDMRMREIILRAFLPKHLKGDPKPPKASFAKASSRVRNALRRLVRSKTIKKVRPGYYSKS